MRLEPLSLEHAEALLEVGRDGSIWRYLSNDPFERVEDAAAFIEGALELRDTGEQVPFAVIDLDSGKLAGTTRYMDIRAPHRAMEIGWTWYGVAYQRSHVNTEAKLLLLEHAFEVLGAVRVQLMTDSRNDRSRAAIARIGAREEGVLRCHKTYPDGYVRDSALFALVAADWPEAKKRLLSRRARSTRRSPAVDRPGD